MLGYIKGGGFHQNSMEENDDCQECKDDRIELGRKTWFVLHTLAEHNDTRHNDRSFKEFMTALSYLYPCPVCAKQIQIYIKNHEPQCTQGWMIDFHNDVNQRLNKPIWIPRDICKQTTRDKEWFEICLMFLIEKIILFDYKQHYETDYRKHTQYWKIFLLSLLNLYIYTPSDSIRKLVQEDTIDLANSDKGQKTLFKLKWMIQLARMHAQSSMALYRQYSSSDSNISISSEE